jgi:hypothetical protein
MPNLKQLCDRCGRPLFEGELRYVAKIEVFAAADPLVITEADLNRDHTILREHLLDQAEAMSEEELMRDVHITREYALCRPCQLAWLRNPLGGKA